jgi:hemolysin activation/secretion protein
MRKTRPLSTKKKSSTSLPLTLQFDHLDSLGLGGISYGSLGWTPGQLTLNSNLAGADRGNTRGRFEKVNFDGVRLQALPANFSLYGHASGQWSKKNLGSSEGFDLGGASGVRAYPSGEASGNVGWLAQVELRISFNQWSPYVFYDDGTIKTDAKPAINATNKRQLSGGGVGLRLSQSSWSADAVLAWRAKGGVATADTSSDPKPRVWITAEYLL